MSSGVNLAGPNQSIGEATLLDSETTSTNFLSTVKGLKSLISSISEDLSGSPLYAVRKTENAMQPYAVYKNTISNNQRAQVKDHGIRFIRLSLYSRSIGQILLPLIPTEEIQHQYREIEFKGGVAGNVPTGGVVQNSGYSMATNYNFLERKGHGIVCDKESLKSVDGQRILIEQIQQLANIMTDTIETMTLAAIWEQCVQQDETVRATGRAQNKTPFGQHYKNSAKFFDVFHKEPRAIYQLYHLMKRAVDKANGDPIDTMVVPESILYYVSTQTERQNYYIGGEEGLQQLKDGPLSFPTLGPAENSSIVLSPSPKGYAIQMLNDMFMNLSQGGTIDCPPPPPSSDYKTSDRDMGLVHIGRGSIERLRLLETLMECNLWGDDGEIRSLDDDRINPAALAQFSEKQLRDLPFHELRTGEDGVYPKDSPFKKGGKNWDSDDDSDDEEDYRRRAFPKKYGFKNSKKARIEIADQVKKGYIGIKRIGQIDPKYLNYSVKNAMIDSIIDNLPDSIRDKAGLALQQLAQLAWASNNFDIEDENVQLFGKTLFKNNSFAPKRYFSDEAPSIHGFDEIRGKTSGVPIITRSIVDTDVVNAPTDAPKLGQTDLNLDHLVDVVALSYATTLNAVGVTNAKAVNFIGTNIAAGKIDFDYDDNVTKLDIGALLEANTKLEILQKTNNCFFTAAFKIEQIASLTSEQKNAAFLKLAMYLLLNIDIEKHVFAATIVDEVKKLYDNLLPMIAHIDTFMQILQIQNNVADFLEKMYKQYVETPSVAAYTDTDAITTLNSTNTINEYFITNNGGTTANPFAANLGSYGASLLKIEKLVNNPTNFHREAIVDYFNSNLQDYIDDNGFKNYVDVAITKKATFIPPPPKTTSVAASTPPLPTAPSIPTSFPLPFSAAKTTAPLTGSLPYDPTKLAYPLFIGSLDGFEALAKLNPNVNTSYSDAIANVRQNLPVFKAISQHLGSILSSELFDDIFTGRHFTDRSVASVQFDNALALNNVPLFVRRDGEDRKFNEEAKPFTLPINPETVAEKLYIVSFVGEALKIIQKKGGSGWYVDATLEKAFDVSLSELLKEATRELQRQKWDVSADRDNVSKWLKEAVSKAKYIYSVHRQSGLANIKKYFRTSLVCGPKFIRSYYEKVLKPKNDASAADPGITEYLVPANPLNFDIPWLTLDTKNVSGIATYLEGLHESFSIEEVDNGVWAKINNVPHAARVFLPILNPRMYEETLIKSKGGPAKVNDDGSEFLNEIDECYHPENQRGKVLIIKQFCKEVTESPVLRWNYADTIANMHDSLRRYLMINLLYCRTNKKALARMIKGNCLPWCNVAVVRGWMMFYTAKMFACKRGPETGMIMWKEPMYSAGSDTSNDVVEYNAKFWIGHMFFKRQNYTHMNFVFVERYLRGGDCTFIDVSSPDNNELKKVMHGDDGAKGSLLALALPPNIYEITGPVFLTGDMEQSPYGERPDIDNDGSAVYLPTLPFYNGLYRFQELVSDSSSKYTDMEINCLVGPGLVYYPEPKTGHLTIKKAAVSPYSHMDPEYCGKLTQY